MTQADNVGQPWMRHPEALSLALRELPAYCSRQRWYPAKDAGAPALAVEVLIPFPDSDGDAALAIWKVSVEGRESFEIFVPLSIVSRDQGDAHLPAIGKLPDGRVVIDAVDNDSFVKGLVQLMLRGSRSQSRGLQAGHTDQIAALREADVPLWQIKRSTVEQSNTSIRVADRSLLKVIRKVAPGIHPELEMTRFLTEEAAHFRAIPALLGWVNLGDKTIAILQEFISNEGDGWTWSRAQLQAGRAGSERAKEWLAALGQRTAEMHAALNVPNADAAFKTETADRGDWQRWARDLSAMAERARAALVTTLPSLDREAQRLAEEFNESAGSLDEWLAGFVTTAPAWQKTRHHGDYHLGQVLVSGDDAVIVDFEGEPLRSLEERRAKHVPLRDVAGMLRSIQYVSASVQRELPSNLSPGERSTEIARLNEWAADASRSFMESYLTRLREKSAAPIDAATATSIVQFFLLEKAVYEVLYESANRPTWTSIPLQHVVSQFAEMKRSPPSRGAR